ncbi:hypothetical protein C1H46_013049, partial [Malus baccata]
GRGRELTGGRHQNSSDNLCIEDCHISTGDDLFFIKSGWDEFGNLYGRPSRNIILLRITGKTETSAGIAIGSEMSGVVSEVHAEDLHFFGSKTGIAIRFTSQYEERPDEFYDPNALIVERITFKDIIVENIKTAGLLEGLEGETFLIICLTNITRSVTSKSPWKCSSIQGYSNSVSPETCKPLKQRISPEHYSVCYSLSDGMWISSSNQNRGAWRLSW